MVDAASTYSSSLSCPLELVCATDFVDFGCLVKYEHLREKGKLQALDTVEKLRKFRQTCLMLFQSHQSFALGVPDRSGSHYKAMCAAACTIAKIANVSLHSVFLWVDCSSMPLELCDC